MTENHYLEITQQFDMGRRGHTVCLMISNSMNKTRWIRIVSLLFTQPFSKCHRTLPSTWRALTTTQEKGKIMSFRKKYILFAENYPTACREHQWLLFYMHAACNPDLKHNSLKLCYLPLLTPYSVTHQNIFKITCTLNCTAHQEVRLQKKKKKQKPCPAVQWSIKTLFSA